mgnify:CR=1 FL=1
MKTLATKILILLMLMPQVAVLAQYQYCIDVNPPKKHFVKFKDRREINKMEDESEKALQLVRKVRKESSEKIAQHSYKIQTRKVRKRMLASRCKAANFNGNKSFWCSNLHKIKRHG